MRIFYLLYVFCFFPFSLLVASQEKFSFQTSKKQNDWLKFFTSYEGSSYPPFQKWLRAVTIK